MGFFFLLAQISFPYGNATYWLPGSTVKLPWEINITSSNIALTQWSFTRSGSTKPKVLAEKSRRASVPDIFDQTYTIINRATVVFQNANLSHNGTYSLAVIFSAGDQQVSNILVIILGKKPVNFSKNMPDLES